LSELEIKTDFKNVNQAIDAAVNDYPNNIAILYRGEEIKYKDFSEKIMQVGNALKDSGVKKGDKVEAIIKATEVMVGKD